ncbi:unnamed protein product [Arctia plantaginis]|uniref:Uncharacterized protein n=1 Tax=Arctia plantaginis TaxID=874455 RepID=A0A8S1BCU3_ARCPL|nr:unnamed protein product [Arctia plantaginis]
MKFLAVAFAIVLVVQLADVTADKLPFNDLMETYGEQQNLGVAPAQRATHNVEDVVSDVEYVSLLEFVAVSDKLTFLATASSSIFIKSFI